jgi:NDP-sugar pyrophosphorylase family protein
VKFTEKPKSDGWMNAGFFVFQRKFFEYLGGDDCVLEREPMERLAADRQLVAYRHEGFFYAMDTYREYQHLNDLWNRSMAPWKVWADAPADATRRTQVRRQPAGGDLPVHPRPMSPERGEFT